MSLMMRVSMVAALGLGLSAAPQALPVCRATSAPQQVQLVELYTSEGCNSCPPADRWLSSLAQRPDVLAVAFHVDYWNRLGWVDRFASPLYTARQTSQVAGSGAGFAYTPQVLVNGRDWRGWPRLPGVDARALVNITLMRELDGAVRVSVRSDPGSPPGLALWWAQLEDGHVSQVLAGENKGAQLRHDRVVRQYGQAKAWRSPPGAVHEVRVALTYERDSRHAARFLVVVVDASTGAPLQATELDC